MTKSTITRLSAVQKALSESGIAKDQSNQQQRYKYRGIDQLMNALAPILAANELLIMSSTTNHTTEKLTKGIRHIVSVDFTVIGPEGSLGPFSSMGECVDFGDKGLNKAIGAAYKYWVFTSLCVPTESTEDADATSPESEEALVSYVGDPEIAEINRLMSATDTDTAQFCAYLKVDTLEAIPMNKFASVIAMLKKKQDKMAEQYANDEAATAQSLGEG